MSVLPTTFTREDARNLQKALNEKTRVTPALVTDGLFGAKSVQALTLYQRQNGLAQTGQYDAATQATLADFIAGRYVQLSDLVAAAQDLNVELPAMRAIAEVEAKGDGFLPDGQTKILLERHKLYGEVVKILGRAGADKLAAANPDVINANAGGYTLTGEWARLNKAMKLCQDLPGGEEAVYRSASWGMFQIMGFNCLQAGYKTAKEMALDYARSESVHLASFKTFIKNDSNLLAALRAKDWTRFARGYNGSGYAQYQYDVKMKAAYDKFAR